MSDPITPPPNRADQTNFLLGQLTEQARQQTVALTNLTGEFAKLQGKQDEQGLLIASLQASSLNARESARERTQVANWKVQIPGAVSAAITGIIAILALFHVIQ